MRVLCWMAVVLLAVACGSLLGKPPETDYRWLEPPHDAEALAWARARTDQSKRRLSGSSSYPSVSSELETALQVAASEPDVVLGGAHALRFLKNADHPYGQLQYAVRSEDGAPGEWTVALDVASLREAEGIAYELKTYSLDSDCLAPEFRRCILQLSPGGGDEVELREFDLEAGRFVEDGFRTPRSRAFSQWLDPDTLLVGHTVGDAPKTAAGWSAGVYLWRRGTALEDAVRVFTAEPTDALVQLYAVGEGIDRRGLVVRALDYSTFELAFVDRDGGIEPLVLPSKLAPMGPLAFARGHLVIKLAEDAEIEGVSYPAESLLSYATVAPEGGRRVESIFKPEDGIQALTGSTVVGVGDGVAFVTGRKLRQSVQLATHVPGAGWTASRIRDIPAGAVATLSSVHDDEDRFIVATTGFTSPRRQELVSLDGKSVLLAKDPDAIDPGRFETIIGSATSRDGTAVDYYLLRPVASPREDRPVLVTGYAAFGISCEPSYFGYTVGGPAFKLWLDRNGALVIPAARGGGERGEGWHRAAMRELRQNSYDDFVAVVEHLVATGQAGAGRIGVFGSSNGGLLAATLGIQRPDLFSAVVSDVPLTDMLRMRNMGMGSAWINEYGNPDDPAEARAMLGYSPFHNVRDGEDYPPFLITISTEDNRVGPGHARKLAARLEDAGGDVYFLEAEEGGHGVSDGFRNPELMSMRMTFLIDRLMR